MSARNRLLMRYLPVIALCMSTGCSDVYVTELTTRDGQILIVIKEPGDSSELVYGVVSGQSIVNGPKEIGLCHVHERSRAKPDQFILLEGTTWCAIVLPVYLDADDIDVMSDTLEPAPLIVDRETGEVYYTVGEEVYLAGGDGGEVCLPESISESLRSSIRTLRSERSQRPRENRWLRKN